MIVYRATNKKNGKVYIGKTVYTLDKRKQQHNYANRKTYFQYALKKYGIDEFVWEIIYSTNDEQELSKKEAYYIKILKSNQRDFGYNLTEGGEGITGYKHTEECKAAARKRMLGKNNPMYRLFGHNNPHFGLKRSEETKRKMRKGDEFKKQVSLRQTGRVKTKDERIMIQLGAIRYLYHFQNNNETFFGVWDITTFCKDHNINYKVLRNLFSINKEKIKYKKWNIWRTVLPRFSSSFFTNYLCSSYPCHSFERINCKFCFCPIFTYDCGGNYKLLENGIKDCSNCEIPHKENGHDYIVDFIEKQWRKNNDNNRQT